MRGDHCACCFPNVGRLSVAVAVADQHAAVATRSGADAAISWALAQPAGTMQKAMRLQLDRSMPAWANTCRKAAASPLPSVAGKPSKLPALTLQR